MSELPPSDPGVDPRHRNSPTVLIGEALGSAAIWLRADKRHKAIAGLGVSTFALLIACLVLATRPPETVVKNVEVPVKASLVTVIAAKGEDLGSIGAKDGVSRITMVGLNIDLIRKNTVRCGDKRTDNCRRDDFGEEKDLAFDAMWDGDPVLTIKQGTLEQIPALASTATQ